MKTLRYRAVIGALLLLFFSGCSTMQGFGQDIRKLGNAIERAAD